MQLPSNVADRMDLHHCSCGEVFSLPVWHCPTVGCDHHWPMARTYCANCQAEKPDGASGGLPALVDRAASALSGARTAAEVLEAKELAGLAYDAAKRAGRLARAKDAHDTLIAAAYRAQADALEIESEAKRRLADEYDAAQQRGDVARQGQRTDLLGEGEKVPTPSDLGLRYDQIHEARTFRDAERADPGITRRTLNEHIERGEEPTKAALRKAVVEAARQGFRGNGAPNKNPIYEPPTEASKAWTHLYGTCRALSEWATDENIALAVRGRSERRDDQTRNVAAVRRALDALTEIGGMIDG